MPRTNSRYRISHVDADTTANALHTWILYDPARLRFPSLGACADHLVGLMDMVFLPKLQRMTCSIEYIEHPESERVGIAKLVRLLNSLEIEAHEIEWRSRWFAQPASQTV